jgi:hypothetical protein
MGGGGGDYGGMHGAVKVPLKPHGRWSCAVWYSASVASTAAAASAAAAVVAVVVDKPWVAYQLRGSWGAEAEAGEQQRETEIFDRRRAFACGWSS